MSFNMRQSRAYLAHGEKGSMVDRAGGIENYEANARRIADKERAKKEAGWVDVFNFSDSFTDTKYGCRNGWVRREVIIKDIQSLLKTKEMKVSVYRPADFAHHSSLYLVPPEWDDNKGTKEELDLTKIGEATYKDGVIESIQTF